MEGYYFALAVQCVLFISLLAFCHRMDSPCCRVEAIGSLDLVGWGLFDWQDISGEGFANYITKHC